jgi:hypothetical protein
MLLSMTDVRPVLENRTPIFIGLSNKPVLHQPQQIPRVLIWKRKKALYAGLSARERLCSLDNLDVIVGKYDGTTMACQLVSRRIVASLQHREPNNDQIMCAVSGGSRSVGRNETYARNDDDAST